MDFYWMKMVFFSKDETKSTQSYERTSTNAKVKILKKVYKARISIYICDQFLKYSKP